jgi:hypothetical protein
MENSITFEDISENLQYACPAILGESYLDDSKFELLFMETLRKAPPLETFLEKVITDLDPKSSETIQFINKHLKGIARTEAIIGSTHALIISSKEPYMLDEERACALLACTVKDLPENLQEECSYLIPKELRSEFRVALKCLNDPYISGDLRQEYEFRHEHDSSSPELRIKTIAFDASKAILYSTGLNILSRATGNDIEKLQNANSNLFRYSPISEGATQTGYDRRNEKMITGVKSKIIENLRSLKESDISFT